jgi:hypothetical protein
MTHHFRVALKLLWRIFSYYHDNFLLFSVFVLPKFASQAAVDNFFRFTKLKIFV